MKKFNNQEALTAFVEMLKKLDNYDSSKDEFLSESYSYIDGNVDRTDEFIYNSIGPWKVVFSDRENEYYIVVYHLTDHDVYIKATGDYTSHVGLDMEYASISVVKPVEVTKIVYEHVVI